MSLVLFTALDKDTQTRIEVACSYVNLKIADQR